MNRGKFSVLISVYKNDNPQHFRDSLASVIGQTLIPENIVLVVDGEVTTVLKEEIRKLKSQIGDCLDVVSLPENVGLGAALAIGLSRCRFDIVARMDSDDISISDRFRKQFNYLVSNPDVAVVGAHIEEFDSEPGDLSRFRKLPLAYPELKQFAKKRNPLNHPSVMFRKDIIQEVGGYLHMPYFEDYFLWVRLLHRGFKIANIDEVLLYFRVGQGMLGRRHGFGYAIYEYRFFKEIMRLGFINTAQFISVVSFRFPVRIMPMNALKIVYKLLLR